MHAHMEEQVDYDSTLAQEYSKGKADLNTSTADNRTEHSQKEADHGHKVESLKADDDAEREYYNGEKTAFPAGVLSCIRSCAERYSSDGDTAHPAYLPPDLEVPPRLSGREVVYVYTSPSSDELYVCLYTRNIASFTSGNMALSFPMSLHWMQVGMSTSFWQRHRLRSEKKSSMHKLEFLVAPVASGKAKIVERQLISKLSNMGCRLMNTSRGFQHDADAADRT